MAFIVKWWHHSSVVACSGRQLAKLPVDVHTGKLVVVGAVLGCLAPVLSIAAAAAHKSPFCAPFDQQDAATRARLAMAAPGHLTTLLVCANRSLHCNWDSNGQSAGIYNWDGDEE